MKMLWQVKWLIKGEVRGFMEKKKRQSRTQKLAIEREQKIKELRLEFKEHIEPVCN